MRLEVRHRTKDLQLIAAKTAERMACEQMVITRGRSGSLCYHVRDGSSRSLPLRRGLFDRIGAGDALLAVASLCAATGVPINLTGFIGNAIGAVRGRNGGQSQRRLAQKIYGGKSTN